MSRVTVDIAADWTHATASVSEHGLVQDRRPSTEQLLALAEVLDILAVEQMFVRYRIDGLPRGRYRLTGEIRARVTQACVVTLEPVVNQITEQIDAEFWPASAIPATEAKSAEEEQSILDAPEHEPIEDHRMAVGRVVVETLAAALPAFPRAADAELEQTEAGPDEGATTHPFAALADWKPTPE